MSSHLHPPTGLEYRATGATSVRVRWMPDPEADLYEVRGGGSKIVMATTMTSADIRGLRQGRQATIEVRTARGAARSAWASIEVRPATPIAPPPTDYGVIRVEDADRQSLLMRLPDNLGGQLEVRLWLWWQPSDAGWWAGIEAPVNQWLIRSRSLALNAGLFDDVKGDLAGNIVIRATQSGSTEEPGRRAFVDRTHELRWEPDA